MIKIGNLEISNIKLGSLTINKVFVGDEQIFPSSQPVETDLVIIYNAKSTSTPTKIITVPSYATSMKVDGVEVSPVTTGYTFSTTGEHEIRFTLADPTNISTDAFSACYDITKVTIPYGVKYIGINAFDANSSLTSVTIPNSVTTIGRNAFICPKLTSVTIPDSVTSIGEWAFGSGNATITVSTGNTVYDSRNDCNAIIETATNTLIIGNNRSYIPSDITSIAAKAFIYCSGLREIAIPEGVTSIGDEAFRGCSGLEHIDMRPFDPPTLGESAFTDDTYCPIIVPDGTEDTYKSEPSWNAYKGRIYGEFDNPLGIMTPESVPSAELVVTYNVENDGDTVKIYDSPSFTFTEGEVISEGGTITPGQTGYTFQHSGEHTIVFRGTNDIIPDSCFRNCDKLVDIKMPEGITIHPFAFAYTGLETLIIPKDATLNSYAISDCNNLTKLVLWCSTIPEQSIANCPNLTKIQFGDDGENGEAIGAVTEIGRSAFYNVPVENVYLPDSVTSIGDEAFSYCQSLTGATIGKGITTIGAVAFSIPSLECVGVRKGLPPSQSHSFDGSYPIYVNSTYLYKQQWSEYADRIQEY